MMGKLNFFNKMCLEEKDEENLLLLKEKLIDLTLNSTSEIENIANLDYKLEDFIEEFVEKINVKILDFCEDSAEISEKSEKSEKNEKNEKNLLLFTKCVDLLNSSRIPHIFEKNVEKLVELQVKTFNNLSCIQQKRKNFQLALQTTDFVLKIESSARETGENRGEMTRNIIKTYLNQSVIFSALKKHENSVKSLDSALFFIEKLEKIGKGNEGNDDLQGVLYLKMVCFFNLAAENEHLNLFTKAIAFYQDALKLAREIGNGDVAKKSESALAKLKKKNQKN